MDVMGSACARADGSAGGRSPETSPGDSPGTVFCVFPLVALAADNGGQEEDGKNDADVMHVCGCCWLIACSASVCPRRCFRLRLSHAYANLDCWVALLLSYYYFSSFFL